MILLYMNYQEKYLKYKKKYINLKNQSGGSTSHIEDSNFSMVNTLGSCWNIAINMIMLVGDSTRDAITEKATNNTAEAIFESGKQLLINILSDIINVESKKENLIKLIKNIQKRLGIFYQNNIIQGQNNIIQGQNNIIQGQNNIIQSQEQNMLTCEKDFNSNYNIIVGRSEKTEGGDDDDDFILCNIISIFFLNKFVQIDYHKLNNNLIPIDKINNCIGILASKARTTNRIEWESGHAMCFYKYFSCNKFCNNSTIINYNWNELFNTYNTNINSDPEILYDQNQSHGLVLTIQQLDRNKKISITNIIPINKQECKGGISQVIPKTIDYNNLKKIGTIMILSLVEPIDPIKFKSDNIIQIIRFKYSNNNLIEYLNTYPDLINKKIHINLKHPTT